MSILDLPFSSPALINLSHLNMLFMRYGEEVERELLPEGVEVHVSYDRSRLIERAICATSSECVRRVR